MKINNQYTSRAVITKEFEIELDNGETLQVCKHWDNDDVFNTYENDYEINEDDKKNVFDKLPEEEQDKVIDFINELA